MTIREYLEQIGTTPAEMSAKVVSRMEQRMLTDGDLQGLQFDTVVKLLNDAIARAVAAGDMLDDGCLQAGPKAAALQRAIDSARATQEEIRAQIKGLEGLHIGDERTRDAVLAYRATIEATQAVFGEANMTEAVMVAAINAGSYMGWRSIVGARDELQTVKPKVRPL